MAQSAASPTIEQTKAADSFSIAVMGDSISDEYRADNNRGGSYAETTLNWIEQLVKYRDLDFGTYANWGGSRRTGYEYNFSRSGATTGSALDAGVHTSIAALVEAGTVQYVYYELGSNDFAWYNDTFGQIYNGQLSGKALNAYIQKTLTNIITALDTINPSHKAKILVSLLPVLTQSPFAQVQFPDPVKIKKVTDAIIQVNDGIRLAVSERGYSLFDVNALAAIMFSTLDAQGNIVVGGEKFSFATSGDEPHHVILSDDIHSGTVVSGMYANAWIAAANAAFGTDIQPFSDEELLAHAGINESSAAGATQPSQSILTTAQSFLQKLFGMEAP